MALLNIGRKRSEALAKGLLWAAALLTIGVLLFIIAHILQRGLPVLSPGFLLGSPEHLGREGGIFPTIVGTVFLTLVALAIAAPLGVGTAVFLTEYTRESRVTRIIRFGTESLAGVPSIIFGLFGFAFFVIFLGLGWSLLSGGLTLAAMILPTIIRTSEEAILAVPLSYRQVSFALGASRWQTVTRVVLPTALPGIITGVILGIGRSVGETAAVILTAGSSLRVPTSIFSPARTMSVHFYILAREGISLEMAYGTGALLIISVLAVNLVANWLMSRLVLRG
ncbi:MAG: phosphate ABC transporter permease PstA [Chloroflexota bacterium]